MSGVESSSVPGGQVTGDPERATDTLHRWDRGTDVPKALTGGLALLFWGGS